MGEIKLYQNENTVAPIYHYVSIAIIDVSMERTYFNCKFIKVRKNLQA